MEREQFSVTESTRSSNGLELSLKKRRSRVIPDDLYKTHEIPRERLARMRGACFSWRFLQAADFVWMRLNVS